MSSSFYLDTDTTPAIRSRYAHMGLAKAIELALTLVGRTDEGQIGIYTSCIGDGFKGYAIKYPNSEPYFEPNVDERVA
jgi:hypothetical protein